MIEQMPTKEEWDEYFAYESRIHKIVIAMKTSEKHTENIKL